MADYPVFDELKFESHTLRETGKNSDGNSRVSTSFNKDVEDIMSELSFLLISKHQDYGPKNISEAPGGAINGLLVRMHDKMARLKNLHYNNKSANYESIEDTYKDLANYAVIALMVLRDKWDK
jgi:hypothetical protein